MKFFIIFVIFVSCRAENSRKVEWVEVKILLRTKNELNSFSCPRVLQEMELRQVNLEISSNYLKMSDFDLKFFESQIVKLTEKSKELSENRQKHYLNVIKSYQNSANDLRKSNSKRAYEFKIYAGALDDLKKFYTKSCWN